MMLTRSHHSSGGSLASGRFRRVGLLICTCTLLWQSGCGEETPPNDEALDAYLDELERNPDLKPSGDLADAAMRSQGLDQEHRGNPFPKSDYALEPPLHPELASGGMPEQGAETDQSQFAAQTAALLSSDRVAREIELTQEERQGRNTWMMWTGGNAAFWDLLARESNGLVDLLKLLDARHIAREDRFRVLGLVPEPGMRPEDGSTIEKDQSKHLENKHGLWLDEPVDGYAPPAGDYSGDSSDDGSSDAAPNPAIYGYPSGIVGLRLFKNPNFDAAAEARWDAERYLNDESYYKDPSLVRPFRVGMACAFCHTSYNPLRPPHDPANPEWENLAGNIGNQYFRVGGIFGYDMRESSIIRQLLNTSNPGTIDTSLVATDGSNNPNTMNAIFGVVERIDITLRAVTAREKVAPQTYQHIGTLDGLELGRLVTTPGSKEAGDADTTEVQGVLARLISDPADVTNNPQLFSVDGYGVVRLRLPDGADRKVPHVLAVGEDSVGTLAALCRVYLNIGEYHQEWIRNHNLMYGLNPQSPFRISVAREHSAYWHASESRAVNLAKYFLKISTPKRLEDADGVTPVIDPDTGRVTGYQIPDPADGNRLRKVLDLRKAKAGATVFAENCFVCHSSKQPDRFWEDPANYQRWQNDPHYITEARQLVQAADFRDGNYFSTDARYPIDLIGTHSGRALADNALEGRVWEDFSSLTYKGFRANKAVNSIFVRHPYENRDYLWKIPRNDEASENGPARTKLYGPGYYRPQSLISAWATAPFLHNNALGDFPKNHDPFLYEEPDVSVLGRLAAFDDAADKLLNPENRHQTIRRTTVDSSLQVPFPVLRGAIARLTGYEPIILFHNSPWVAPGVLLSFGMAIFFWGRGRPRFAFRLASLTFLALALLVIHDTRWGVHLESNGAMQNWGSHTPIATYVRIALLLLAAWGLWSAAKRPARIANLAGLFTVLFAITLFATSWVVATLLLLLGLGLFLGVIDLRYALRALGFGIVVLGSYIVWRDCELMRIFWFPWLVVGIFVIGGVLVFVSKEPEYTLRFVGRLVIGFSVVVFVAGYQLRRDGLSLGHIPKGTPVNLIANINGPGLYEDPERLHTLVEVFADLAEVSKKRLPTLDHPDVPRLVPNLLKINKCPDLVLDRGHTFGKDLSATDKENLIEYLKTL